jgi:hypothetical protein
MATRFVQIVCVALLFATVHAEAEDDGMLDDLLGDLDALAEDDSGSAEEAGDGEECKAVEWEEPEGYKFEEVTKNCNNIHVCGAESFAWDGDDFKHAKLNKEKCGQEWVDKYQTKWMRMKHYQCCTNPDVLPPSELSADVAASEDSKDGDAAELDGDLDQFLDEL